MKACDTLPAPSSRKVKLPLCLTPPCRRRCGRFGGPGRRQATPRPSRRAGRQGAGGTDERVAIHASGVAFPDGELVLREQYRWYFTRGQSRHISRQRLWHPSPDRDGPSRAPPLLGAPGLSPGALANAGDAAPTLRPVPARGAGSPATPGLVLISIFRDSWIGRSSYSTVTTNIFSGL